MTYKTSTRWPPILGFNPSLLRALFFEMAGLNHFSFPFFAVFGLESGQDLFPHWFIWYLGTLYSGLLFIQLLIMGVRWYRGEHIMVEEVTVDKEYLEMLEKNFDTQRAGESLMNMREALEEQRICAKQQREVIRMHHELKQRQTERIEELLGLSQLVEAPAETT
ncbi:hypothetical protein OHC33_009652 [Knufia fluminis]|uniref:Uncharacterized protein n=1 Tax=Knufia fluminis TaxID=191047 RepID=A0AAN8E924_9EURO|nr:hypothetical protein OHC33_009652 [Knufia fluminis]